MIPMVIQTFFVFAIIGMGLLVLRNCSGFVGAMCYKGHVALKIIQGVLGILPIAVIIKFRLYSYLFQLDWSYILGFSWANWANWSVEGFYFMAACIMYLYISAFVSLKLSKTQKEHEE